MSIIHSHDVTLHSLDGRIVLRPLTDAHLPLLYRWNADPEVLYWTEGGEDVARSYTWETVHQIYGGPQDRVMYFLVEANGQPIGECWLQRMNVLEILERYPRREGQPGTGPWLDVRRIDMMIGEKAYWGAGLGTRFVRMLADYAFQKAGVDVLHCFTEDYNIRSRKLWMRLGFTEACAFTLPAGEKGSVQYHYVMRKEDWVG